MGWVVVGSPPGMGVPSKEHHAWLGPLVHGQAGYSLLRVVRLSYRGTNGFGGEYFNLSFKCTTSKEFFQNP